MKENLENSKAVSDSTEDSASIDICTRDESSKDPESGGLQQDIEKCSATSVEVAMKSLDAQDDKLLHSSTKEQITDAKEQNEEEKQTSQRINYLQKMLMFYKLLMTSVDHLSDVFVLIQLWNNGYVGFFFVGMFIDLMPGLVTVVQFRMLGYPAWKALTLLFHPGNIYLHTFWIIFGKLSQKQFDFSMKVVLYSTESRGLLEAPLQLVFTSTLIALSILPSPFDPEQAVIVSNYFGAKINLSFLPVISVMLSFFTITLDASMALSIWNNPMSNKLSVLSWILFLIATILFRLQVWILLSTYLVDFIAAFVGLIYFMNLATFLIHRTKLNIDPFLMALYSIAFPIISLKSIPNEKPEFDFQLKKKLITILNSLSTLILLVPLWIVYIIVIYNKSLPYSSRIIIDREQMVYLMISSTVLAILSFLSPFFIAKEEQVDEGQDEGTLKSTLLRAFREAKRLGYRVGLLLLAIGVFVSGLTSPRIYSKPESLLSVTRVCSNFSANLDILATHQKISNNFTKAFAISRCSKELIARTAETSTNLIGCFNDALVLEDKAPTSPLDNSVKESSYILLHAGHDTDQLKDSVKSNCKITRCGKNSILQKDRATFEYCECPKGFTASDGESEHECSRLPLLPCHQTSDCIYNGHKCFRELCTPTCSNEYDCAFGETCFESKCFQLCSSHKDCTKNNMTCLFAKNNTCQASCIKDGDCSFEEECFQGQCIVRGTQFLPKVVESPKNVTAVEGENIDLVCTVDNLLKSKLSWLRNGKELRTFEPRGRQGGSNYKYTEVHGTGGQNILRVRNIQFGVDNNFTCKISPPPDLDFEPILSTAYISILVPPRLEMKKMPNETHTDYIFCTALDSFPKANLTWYFEPENIILTPEEVTETGHRPGTVTTISKVKVPPDTKQLKAMCSIRNHPALRNHTITSETSQGFSTVTVVKEQSVEEALKPELKRAEENLKRAGDKIKEEVDRAADDVKTFVEEKLPQEATKVAKKVEKEAKRVFKKIKNIFG